MSGPALRILDLTASLLATPLSPATPTVAYPLPGANLPPLDILLLADRLAELYGLVFPDQPDWPEKEVVDWADEEAVAGAVERFLARVSDLFPVHDEIWDVDLEVVESRLYEIPVIPMGFDEWYDGWDELKEPSAYLLHMCHSRRDEEAGRRGRGEFAALYPDHQVPRYLEPHRLVQSLRRAALPQPLDALPDLIEMLSHCTGNIWLDVGECSLMEGGGYPLWSREEVAWLTETWQQARPVLDKIRRLLEWQNGSPAEIGGKLAAVRRALLAAYQQMKMSTQEEQTTSSPRATT